MIKIMIKDNIILIIIIAIILEEVTKTIITHRILIKEEIKVNLIRMVQIVIKRVDWIKIIVQKIINHKIIILVGCKETEVQ